MKLSVIVLTNIFNGEGMEQFDAYMPMGKYVQQHRVKV